MKNKAFLPLFEMIIMIGIFAAAAAVCLSAFAKADTVSRRAEDLDRAVEAAENAAEIIKYTRGDLDAAAELLWGRTRSGSVFVCFDADWSPTDPENAVFRVDAVNCEGELLGKTDVLVYSGERLIYELTVGWQREADDGR